MLKQEFLGRCKRWRPVENPALAFLSGTFNLSWLWQRYLVRHKPPDRDPNILLDEWPYQHVHNINIQDKLLFIVQQVQALKFFRMDHNFKMNKYFIPGDVSVIQLSGIAKTPTL